MGTSTRMHSLALVVLGCGLAAGLGMPEAFDSAPRLRTDPYAHSGRRRRPGGPSPAERLIERQRLARLQVRA